MSSILKVDQLQDSGGNNLVTSNGSGVITSSAFGKVLQVVQTVKTDTFSSSTETTWVDITGLSITITPSSTSSKILLISSVVSSANVSGSGNIVNLQHRYTGGNTANFVGDTASSRNRVAYAISHKNDDYNASQDGRPYTVTYLDSPNTISAVTYQLQGKTGDNTGTTSEMYVNQSSGDTDSSAYGFRAVSTITAMEISG
jgi:hypothetical protein